MTDPGVLRDRVAFQAKVRTGKSDAGQVTTDWVDRFERDARIDFEGGGEAVMAERLAGRQPIRVVVRLDSEVARVTTDWRLRVVRAPTGAGALFNIRSAVPAAAGRELWIRAEGGVAT